MELFGNNLRRRARELSLSDAEVARRAGLSERRYANYVSGAREPDLATLLRICTVLATTPNELLGVEKQITTRSSRMILLDRLNAACQALHDDDLSLATVQLEAIVSFRAAQKQ